MSWRAVHWLLGVLLLYMAGQPLAWAQAPTETSNLYETALNDFRANRIREAVRSLKLLLQKDPKSKEAAMLFGTMFFQNHKPKRAFYWFERGDPSLLSHDNAFAWGSTYLEMDEDAKAELGFRYLLKTKGPFRPFSTYYLGVIAYKSAQWSKARKLFQKVNPEDLTVALRVNRRRYLADIKRQQEKMLESIISSSDKTTQDLSATQLAVEPAAPPSTPPSPGKDNSVDDELEAVKSTPMIEEQKGWRHSFKAGLAVTQQNQLLDNHGLNHDNVSLVAHREMVGGLVNYGDRRTNGGIFGGLDYSLGNVSYSAGLDQVQYFALEDTSGVFTTQASSTEDENAGFVVLQPQLSWYLNDRLRFDLNPGLRLYLPDMDGEQAWGQVSEQLGARYEDGETEIGVEVALLQPFDAKQKKNALDVAGRAEIEKPIGDFRVNLQAYGWQTDQPNFLSASRFRLILADPQLRYRTGFFREVGASGTVSVNVFSDTSLQARVETLAREATPGSRIDRLRSVDSVETVAYGANKALLSINIPLGDSASITGSGAFHLLTDYHFTEIDDQGVLVQEYVTDVQTVTYQVGGMISFAEWIRLSGNYSITGNRFISSAASSAGFRRQNPDYIVDSGIYLELTKSF